MFKILQKFCYKMPLLKLQTNNLTKTNEHFPLFSKLYHVFIALLRRSFGTPFSVFFCLSICLFSNLKSEAVAWRCSFFLKKRKLPPMFSREFYENFQSSNFNPLCFRYIQSYNVRHIRYICSHSGIFWQIQGYSESWHS